MMTPATPPTSQPSLSDAAMRLGLSYWSTRELVLRGRLRGGKDGRGRYYVDAEDLDRLVTERERAGTG